MIRNLLCIAWKRVTNSKFFSVVNIVGLAIGMAVFLLITLYIRFERSYENFIPENENIYRVSLESWVNNERVLASAENYAGLGPALKSELPEVTAFARLYNMGYKNNVVITRTDATPQPIAFMQKRFFYADSAFLPMMGYAMVRGNAATALSQPLTAVISEKYARLYFKNEDPVGKTLLLQDDDFNNERATVTGVFKDIPANTHLKFDVLFSYKTLFTRGDWAHEEFQTNWRANSMYTLVKLVRGVNPREIEGKLAAIVDKYKPEFKQTGWKDILSLQPIKNIHLHSELADEVETNGNSRVVWFMSIIALLVLIIAWINYINLSTARATERAKEVGVRKVVGANKYQLNIQFLTESAIVNLISLALAVILAALALPYFNTLSGVSFTLKDLQQSWFLLTVLALWVSGSFLSGIYPAMLLSSFKPLASLKGKLQHGSLGMMLRKALVVGQFTASIVLIVGTVIIYRQLKYIMNRDLGMNIEQVMVMERPAITKNDRNLFNASMDLFRNELKKSPSVAAVTASLTVPGKQREYKMLVKRRGGAKNDSVVVRANTMDYEFMDVFKMKLMAGRGFSSAFADTQGNTVIVTESAARLLGYTDPSGIVGKTVSATWFDNIQPVVIGVVNDYHQVSLKKRAEPGLFIFDIYRAEMYSVRINTHNITQAVEDVRKAWTKAFPGNPFEYFFLDDYFNRQYAAERKFRNLFMAFAILTIFISCLGLLGLSAYTASRRIKEIGIRKVLGASVTDITAMLSKDFLKLVLIAILAATPLSRYLMVSWLRGFAYRIDIDWWVFAVSGIGAIVLAMIAVSFQAVKAAMANPVKSLRTE